MCYKDEDEENSCGTMNNQLYIYDCLTGKLRASDGAFMTIGGGPRNTFRLPMPTENAGAFAQRNGICRFFPRDDVNSYSINGIQQQGSNLIHPELQYQFVLENACFIVWYGTKEQQPDFRHYNPRNWYIYDPDSGSWSGPRALLELPLSPQTGVEGALASFEGMGHYAFRLDDIIRVASYVAQLDSPLRATHDISSTPRGLYRCPFCREVYAREQALSIATHPELRGDSILGPDEMQRFLPQGEGAVGGIVDSKGMRCIEQACPYCHQRLPLFWDLMPQHFIALTGATSAGKSYYQAALVHELERSLPRKFGLSFRDSDASTNIAINHLRSGIYTPTSPQDAYISRRKLQNKLYRSIFSRGEFTDMPAPFLYTISKGEQVHSIVLYNHAESPHNPAEGEEQDLGGKYLTEANAIFFLFDPLSDSDFRALLRDVNDPQLSHPTGVAGLQTRLLAGMELQLRSSLNIPPGSHLSIPLAIIISKSDAWLHLLGPEPLRQIIREGELALCNIAANSARLRELLFRICPNICTTAESISDNVCYFATSSLGKAPTVFQDKTTEEYHLGPADDDPRPFHVEDAFIWALNCLEPGLLSRRF